MTEASQLGPSDDASVVLDIGGDVGALIINTGPDLHLAEIEMSRVDGGPALPGGGATSAAPNDDHPHDHDHDHDHVHEHDHPHEHGGVPAPRTHVAVRERRGPDGSRWAAIYPELLQGDYVVWGVDGTEADRVRIVGGQVSELDWR